MRDVRACVRCGEVPGEQAKQPATTPTKQGRRKATPPEALQLACRAPPQAYSDILVPRALTASSPKHGAADGGGSPPASATQRAAIPPPCPTRKPPYALAPLTPRPSLPNSQEECPRASPAHRASAPITAPPGPPPLQRRTRLQQVRAPAQEHPTRRNPSSLNKNACATTSATSHLTQVTTTHTHTPRRKRLCPAPQPPCTNIPKHCAKRQNARPLLRRERELRAGTTESRQRASHAKKGATPQRPPTRPLPLLALLQPATASGALRRLSAGAAASATGQGAAQASEATSTAVAARASSSRRLLVTTCTRARARTHHAAGHAHALLPALANDPRGTRPIQHRQASLVPPASSRSLSAATKTHMASSGLPHPTPCRPPAFLPSSRCPHLPAYFPLCFRSPAPALLPLMQPPKEPPSRTW